MKSLRVLLIESSAGESDRVAKCLESGSHAVLPAAGVDEAVQALRFQHFDAVMLSSRLFSSDLGVIRENLNRSQGGGVAQRRIPLFCYTASHLERPTAAELARYQVEACLPEQCDEAFFSQMIAGLASQLGSRGGGTSDDPDALLPALNANEFREQVGFDSELMVEIIDLFLTESDKQLLDMRNALQSGDLLTVSRVAHSLKGSLGSLYATQAAARAQNLEQAGKAGNTEVSSRTFLLLEESLQALKPELVALRNAESSS